MSFSFVCIQFANIILLWPKLHDNWISWCDNYISFKKKKPFIMLRLVNTFVLLILGYFMCPCCIYLLHMHFVSWFIMFSMTSMYLSTFLYLSYKCKFVFKSSCNWINCIMMFIHVFLSGTLNFYFSNFV